MFQQNRVFFTSHSKAFFNTDVDSVYGVYIRFSIKHMIW